MNPSSSRPVLVIDDNQTIHQDFRKILCPGTAAAAAALDELDNAIFGVSRAPVNQFNFAIYSAFQGQEGLALVEDGLKKGIRYPVAFVDVRMPPGWDGVETVARMWQVDPDIQIVICTAYSEYSWDDMVSKLGQSDNLLILKKPFDNIEVQQLATALVEKWHLLQQKKNQIELLEQKVKERTRELEQTAELLRQSQETILRQERLAVVGQLSAGVAHEFNNILTIIQGHTNLLLATGAFDDETVKSLEHISNSSERAAGLTKQMLAFSRKQMMRRQSLDLGKIILRMKDMLQRLLCENISLQCDAAPELPCAWADAGMVEQTIMNLVVNARDALPCGGNLSISATAARFETADLVQNNNVVGSTDRRVGNFVCLMVTDTGHGMDAATMKRIFEPFFTTKDVGKGTGLGLATVYGIAQQHEGWIEVISTVGKGTTFKVFLPIAAASQEATKPIPAATTPLAAAAQTILVVEDEPSVRRLARTVLNGCGYQVFEAASGREALDFCAGNHGKIDLLFTDMMMPEGISGRELAERLQAVSPNLRVVYTSGYSNDVVRGDGTGTKQFFLEKPYNPARLVEIIHRSLGGAAQLTI